MIHSADADFEENGSYRRLRFGKFYGLHWYDSNFVTEYCWLFSFVTLESNNFFFHNFIVTRAMCEGTNNNFDHWQQTSKRDNCRSRTPVMEFESDWIKNKTSSAYTAHIIRAATSIMPWSCRIPIGEGYHEFL